MTRRAHEQDLRLAQRLVERASRAALSMVRAGDTASRSKRDGTPVSTVDLAVERLILDLLAEARPDDQVLSEERGGALGQGRVWVLDPIDGTDALLAGSSSWGPQLALTLDGRPVLGVVARPARALWWFGGLTTPAVRAPLGETRGVAIRTSSRVELATSRASFWTPDAPFREVFVRAGACILSPQLDDILGVAEGRVECVVDPHGKPWDHAPLAAVVEAAGGVFHNLEGGSLVSGVGGVYTNGHIDAAGWWSG